MTRTIVILSDIQAPYEDRKLLRSVIDFIGDYQPDEIVQIGDLADFPKPSRWSKGTAAEFQGDVYEDCKYIKKNFFEPLRAVYSGPLGILEGNHDERPRTYLSSYAPALVGTDHFDFENLLDFDSYGAKKLPDFYDFTPNWVITHGHRGGIRLTQEAGRTALNAATTKFFRSVIMGHTHRLGKVSKSFGYGGEIHRSFTGLEVGNMMDMRLAQYLKGGTANWQQGFAVVHIDGGHVNAQPIEVSDKKFTVDGVTYKVR